MKEKDACILELKEQIRQKEYDRNVYHQQMQSEAKQNLDLKDENEELKKKIEKLMTENEELKKKPEDLMLTNNDPLVSSEPPALISTPKSSIDPQLPLDKSSDTAARYFKDAQISDPMEVDDSESEDDAEESDNQFTPRLSRAAYRQNYNRKSKAKKTEASKVSFQYDILKK